jgi:antitoxin VapB
MDTAKLFRNGRSQAVRLPKNYRLPGTTVFLKKMGNAVVLIPAEDPWRSLIESLELFSPDFMAQRDQPQQPEREDLFE